MGAKRDLAVGLVAAGALALQAPLPAQAQDVDAGRVERATADSTLAGLTVRVRVDGMTCPFCAYGLERRLSKHAAIDEVLVRISDGLVQIREKRDLSITREELFREIKAAGFTPREMERIDP